MRDLVLSELLITPLVIGLFTFSVALVCYNARRANPAFFLSGTIIWSAWSIYMLIGLILDLRAVGRMGPPSSGILLRLFEIAIVPLGALTAVWVIFGLIDFVRYRNSPRE
jgi:hypothetical protein